jgi:hypothetical protein
MVLVAASLGFAATLLTFAVLTLAFRIVMPRRFVVNMQLLAKKSARSTFVAYVVPPENEVNCLY